MSSTRRNIKQRNPPLMGIWLIEVLISEELVEEVLGDLEEIFQDRVKNSGVVKARAHYFLDAILSARNYNLRRPRKITQNNTVPMIRNYIKTIFRNLAKNRVYSALNILGLALGLSACLFIVQYVSYEYSYDKFHSNHENLYRVRYQILKGEEVQVDCAAAVPRVGPFMKETMPEVVDFARAFPMEAVFSRNNIQYREKRIQIVDPSFLKIFDYPLIHGDAASALVEPNKLVITESIAKKYFGETDVVGERIELLTSFEQPLEITGVTRDVPENSHLKYNFLVSYETINQRTIDEESGASYSETSWGWYDFNTYVLLREGTDTKYFDQKFAEVLYEERKEEYEQSSATEAFPLQPITDIHLYSNLLQESEPQEQGDGDTVFFLSMIAAFILIIAWINYINLSTAKSLERAKEVGVRKSMGAYKRQLIYQFLIESFVLNFLALVIALGLVILLTPIFSELADAPLSRAFFLKPEFWLAIVGILALGSVLSGLYPAFLLSSFRPIQILKGKLTTNKSGIFLRRFLVVFQFAASVTLIAGTIIVYRQLNHMKKSDLGFEMTDTMVIRGPHPNDSTFAQRFKSFKEELNGKSTVQLTSSSSNVPGEEIFWTRGMRKQEETRESNFIVYLVSVGYDYFDAYQIDIVSGRNYDRLLTTDTANLLINEAAVASLGINSPQEAIGQKVKYGGNNRTIIGVVSNYHQLSLKNNINPLIFPLDESSADFITAKLNASDYQAIYEDIKASYHNFFPGAPFETFFLDEFYNRQYVNENHFSRTFTLFALFAIFVACLGLFGLTSFSALQRTKEIGIRKVLGAGVSQIVIILSKEFLILVGVANVIAWPLIYLIMNNWLDNFTSRIAIGIPVFIVSAMLVLIIAIIAVGYKTLTISRTNPVNALRYE